MEENKKEQFEEFEKIVTPVSEFIKKHYDMHTTAIVTDSNAKIVRDDIGTPIKHD